MAENIQNPALVHTPLNSMREYTDALDQLIGNARNRLYIFDYNLEDGEYNTAHRFDLLRRFLLGKRGNRLEIVLHDLDYLTRYCPRMMNLLRQFSHAMNISETTSQAKNVYDPFAIADLENYVHRFHYDEPRALFALNDMSGGHTLIKRFEEIRQASGPAIPTTPAGL